MSLKIEHNDSYVLLIDSADSERDIELLKSTAKNSDKQTLYVLTKNAEGSALLDRSLDLGGQDYRLFARASMAVPVDLYNSFEGEDLLSNCPRERLLISQLSKSKVVSALVGQDVQAKKAPFHLWRSFYNFWLLSIRIMERNQDPAHAGWSIAVGAFWACTPLYGLQTFLIFSTCSILRLSFPMAFLGSQISLPPFYGLIVPVAILLGSLILGQPLDWDLPAQELAQQHFMAWVVGSVVFGIIAAAGLGFLGYFIQTRRQKL